MYKVSEPLSGYSARLIDALKLVSDATVDRLELIFKTAGEGEKTIYFIGNGGSAGNALHISNDFLFGVRSGKFRRGLKVVALCANVPIITCLANDVGYEKIYSEQIATYGVSGDVLVALSGSGNSKNILEAVDTAKGIGMKVIGVTGFDGGGLIEKSDLSIHVPVEDMQISEDLQLIVFHNLMQRMASQ